MKRTALFVLAAALSLAACSKSPAPGRGLLTYSSARGRFSLKAPADWRVSPRPEAKRVAFFGPPDGPLAYAVSISVSRHPASSLDYRTPREYYAAQAASGAELGPLQSARWKGHRAYRFASARSEPAMDGRPASRTLSEALLIPSAGGFVEVSRTSSAAALQEARTAFAAACSSLRLR